MPTQTVLTPTVHANFNSVHVVLVPTLDVWEASTVRVQLRVGRLDTWWDCFDMLPDATATAPLATRYDGWIPGLAEGTSYPYQIVWTRTADDDGAELERVYYHGYVTTRRSPTHGAGGTTVYMAHNAANDSGDGSSSQPKKTFTGAAAVANMQTIVMKNGTYTAIDWESSSAYRILDKVGTATNYKVLKAETPGGVVVSGARAMNGLTWTQYNPGGGPVARVYKCDFSAYMDTSASPKRAPLFIRRKGASGVNDSKGGFMFASTSLTADASGKPAIASGTDLSFGFTYKWSTNELYLRLGQDQTDATPGDNQYECSDWFYCLMLTDCSYWIIDGIEWEMFGGVRYDGTNDVGPGTLGAFAGVVAPFVINFNNDAVSNIVVRNCTFDFCWVRIDASGGGNITAITFEDCDWICTDHWASHVIGVTAVTAAKSYDRMHSTANDSRAILYQAAHQLVVRRCAFSGLDECVSFADDGGNYSDVYDCTFTHCMDEPIACDVANGCRNFAVWNCHANGAFWFCSTSPYDYGPFYCVGNSMTDPLADSWCKPGSNGADGGGHKVYANCTTFISGDIDNQCIDSSCWRGGTHWNTKVYNMILQHGSTATLADATYYINEGADPLQSHQPPGVQFYTCAFYATSPRSSPFIWENTAYASEAAMLAAVADDELAITGCVYGTGATNDPFPDGNSGPVNPAFPASTEVLGVTDFLADANGFPFGSRKLPWGKAYGIAGETWTPPRNLVGAMLRR